MEDKVDELLSNGKPHKKKGIHKKDYGLPAYQVWKNAYLAIRFDNIFEGKKCSGKELLTKVKE